MQSDRSIANGDGMCIKHCLRLAHGRLSARVTAPPRLFVVDTPAATAIDLGCAYDLAVLTDGRVQPQPVRWRPRSAC